MRAHDRARGARTRCAQLVAHAVLAHGRVRGRVGGHARGAHTRSRAFTWSSTACAHRVCAPRVRTACAHRVREPRARTASLSWCTHAVAHGVRTHGHPRGLRTGIVLDARIRCTHAVSHIVHACGRAGGHAHGVRGALSFVIHINLFKILMNNFL